MKVSLRSHVESDLPFIFSTWLKGLYHGNPLYRKIEQGIFYPKYHKVLEAVLKSSTVVVACLEDEPDVVLGYAVYRDLTMHWIFVKKAWRKMGIAKQLVVPNITAVSHLTKIGESLIKSKGLNWKFDPFLF